jgi:uncharacterized protein (TIGR03435 family)
LREVTGQLQNGAMHLPGPFVVEWQPDSPALGQEPPATSDAPLSIFTTLREGVGLQLKPATGPVDSVIIDKLEKPNDN